MINVAAALTFSPRFTLTLELVRLLEIINNTKETKEVLFLIMKNTYTFRNCHMKNYYFLSFTSNQQNKNINKYISYI